MPILLPCLGSNASLKLFGGVGKELRIVDRDLARIDVADAERILHRRDEVLGVLELRIVDRLGNARLVHLEHLRGGEALDVGRAARQAPLGHHLGAARGVARLILRDLEALRLQDRVLDVLREQARVVAAPGADDDAARCACAGRSNAGRRHRSEAETQCVTPREFACHVPSSVSFSSVSAQTPCRHRDAKPPSTSSPTAGAAHRRGSAVARPRGRPATGAHAVPARRPRYETNSTLPGMALSIPFAPPRCSRSGRSSSEAAPGAPSRHLSLQPAAGLELARRGDAAVEERAAPDESRDKAIGRALVEVALRADLADFALGHHHQPVGDGQRLFLVMRHHDGGQPELALQLADLDAHLFAQLGVEVGQRLVEQQHVRPDRERAGERDALLLPAGQLARQPRSQIPRAAPGAALRACAPRSRASTSLRISSPNATLSATVMCGNSA